jgi:hypothetical protein
LKGSKAVLIPEDKETSVNLHLTLMKNFIPERISDQKSQNNNNGREKRKKKKEAKKTKENKTERTTFE